MRDEKRKKSLRQSEISKPYCSIGAGRLTSFVWKSGDEDCGWRYRFNLFRLGANGGRVTQLFAPADLMHLIKLTQVLASVIADDGCLSAVDRGVLKRLATDLDQMLAKAANRSTPVGTHPNSSEDVRDKPCNESKGDQI